MTLVVAMGCTGRSNETPSSCWVPASDLEPVPLAQVASTQAAEACLAWGDCRCGTDTPETVPSCRHSWNMTFEAHAQAAMDAGLTYDGECLAQHVRDLQDLGCETESMVEREDWSVLGVGRCGIFHGSRRLGDACQAYPGGLSDCAQGLACWHGTCVDPCEQTEHGPRCGAAFNFACPPDQECAGETCADPEEEVLPGVGEDCSGRCEPGAWCEILVCEEDCWGLCREQVDNGDPCPEDAACGSGHCAEGVCADPPVVAAVCTVRN